jgi:hypothetical protein
MKKYFLFFFLLIKALYAQQDSSSFFPLQIGNQWDYRVDVHVPGGNISTEYFSVSIVDSQVIDSVRYFVFSPSLPFTFPVSKYFRTDGDKVFCYDEEDSSDCFIYRFDLPVGIKYYNCKIFENEIFFIDTVYFWDQMDVVQLQNLNSFSEHYGVYEAFVPGIVEYTYYLLGCKIDGILYGTPLSERTEKLFQNYSIEQNFPNPFNPSTKIKYSIPAAGNVTIKVFDVLGKEIKTLVDEYKDAGSYEVDFSAAGGANELSSGVYVYKIASGSYSEIKKMVLLR